MAARDSKEEVPGLIGRPELKAIFGVFDVLRTGSINLAQYKEGADSADGEDVATVLSD